MRAKRSIEDLLNRIQGVREQLKDYNLAPDHVKCDTRLYAMREAAELIGRSDQTIRDAEADGRLATPEIGPNGKRIGYTLAQINDARDVLGTRLKRATDEEPVVIGCQSFKGGSGKTTTAVHLTQYLARQGLRVLLVDCDPQASATAIFGYVPEADLSPDETLLPFLEGDRDDLVYSVRATYFDGVYLVPSNLHLYRSEYTLASGTAKLDRLKEGIDTIAAGFDVVVIDPPPSLGMISLNALYASNALIIPMSLGLLDFYSTVSFVQMLNETLGMIEQRVGIVRSKFVKVLMTRVNEGKPVHIQLADHLQASFGTYLMKARMHDSAAVDNAGVMMRTVYELEKTSANRKTLIRATMLFDLVNAEILSLIRATWPSHHKALRAQGLM